MTSHQISNRVVVGLIRNSQHKLLIIKIKEEYKSKYNNHDYIFPQAFLLEGELDRDGLEKHLYEMTGYQIDAIAQASYQYDKELEREVYYYYCRTNSNIQSVIDGIDDFETFLWIDVKKIDNYIPYLNKEVDDLLKHIKFEN